MVECDNQTPPGITALVCTRNRGESVAATVRALLASAYDCFEVLVVDQSTDDRSERGLDEWRADARLRYVRISSQGKGVALNHGLALAEHDLVAITDDDCEPPPHWLRVMAEQFARDPRVAVAYCQVVPGPHNPRDGFVPAYTRQGEHTLTSVLERRRHRGIGAGMAVRRSHVSALGGFDERLGPGAKFSDYEDVDIAVRALLRGYLVRETDQAAVVHHGFRTWEQGREMARRNYYGIGAGHAKYLKCGRLSPMALALHETFLFILLPAVLDAARLRRPRVLSRARGYLAGFLAGLRHPVDRRAIRYR